uniref:NADH dehydrogenase subunit 4L n=1 Tax=Ergasilus anchoratus TaxID=342414 RepID=UPI002E76C201|nr:NADH dehydrogenase subunit 4L [Ergasilus anchoratus]UUB71178.1 NADH dehydrogenase subunit 4L [Ergasilus anchoratus]
MMMVLVVLWFNSFGLNSMLILSTLWLVIMVMSYSKWNSHLSVLLINLEFFTLILLYTMFFSFMGLGVNISMLMLIITSLVMEACLGLALLILMVRLQKMESLISSLM